jgi:hypothetical protein
MRKWRQVDLRPEHIALVHATYRPDLYRAALHGLDVDLPERDLKPERFFDGQIFDPKDLDLG